MRRGPGGAKWRNELAGCGWYLTNTTRCCAWTGSARTNPAIVVGAGNGWWQAVIPASDGEIVTTRYTLRALLDKLDELLGANPRHQ